MTKLIPVGKNHVAMVDDEDYERVSQYRWRLNGKGYARAHGKFLGVITSRTGKKYNGYEIILMHRLVTNAPDGMQVDHQDHNGLNNTKGNLRVCTQSQNQANQRPRTRPKKSPFKGVTCTRGHWVAHIQVDHRNIHLGYFNSDVEAARAYNRAALEHFGQFARLNEVG